MSNPSVYENGRLNVTEIKRRLSEIRTSIDQGEAGLDQGAVGPLCIETVGAAAVLSGLAHEVLDVLSPAKSYQSAHELAVEQGRWEGLDPLSTDTIFDKLNLIICEVVAAMDQAQSGALGLYTQDGKLKGMVVELADAVIRIGDLCEAVGVDLGEALRLRHDCDRSRGTWVGEE